MQFGLSTHLFHGERLGARQLDAIAAHGFETVEVFATRTHFDYHDARRIAELRSALAGAGLQATSMHAPICAGYSGGEWGRAFTNAASDAGRRREAIDETRAAFAAASELGCETMVLHLGVPQGQAIGPGDNDRGAVRRSLAELYAASAEARVRLALENMPNGLSTPAALVDFLADEAESADAAVCLDFGHAHLMGGAAEAVEALSGHIVTTHVHDNNGRDDNHLVPFEGSLDWPSAFAALWKVGYAGRLVFEVADHGDAAAALERTTTARRRLQALLEDLTKPMEF